MCLFNCHILRGFVMAFISLSNVFFGYDSDRNLLSGLSVVFNDSDKVAVVGDNGAGKTTLLRILNGDVVPDSGQCVKNASVYMLKQINVQDAKSGGEAQSNALARAFDSRAEILLLDEPFSALDYQTRLSVSDDVYQILKNENKSAIIVTHDLAEAISMADRIIVLTKRPSTIKNIYEIKLTDKSTPIKNRRAKEFSYYYDKIWKDIDFYA